MVSKFCPICENIISMDGVPRFCCYGCGSLASQHILPKFNSIAEREAIIEQAKKEYKERQAPAVEICPGRLQMRLF